MCKWIITAALVLGAAATAGAADLQTEVGELAVALKARVDAGAGGKELNQQSTPEGTALFKGGVTFKLGNFSPFAYVFPNTLISDSLF